MKEKEKPLVAANQALQGVQNKSHRNYTNLPDNLQDRSNNSAASQRQRILHHLKTTGSLTTLQARHKLDTMHPGMRVCELRKLGHPIQTVWVDDVTPEGYLHRVGMYILRPNQQQMLPGMEV
ncbi:helix-turn-helix domain-containing protein [Desulfopila sp. IMCC35008]|uniref:helix-turn-helix domain-containing protein n=1 Tax=Desulfopila sp. IMCC35008 TaxID=2653858 RepID=UPI0013D2321F|nr:helix-turn-helix domain-containing protein [Desulfopila sp. IMCC35008]